ncbi:MAG: porphobilinogen synthase, partial [Planctomycetes bacterium]|nr:porphobilinogen synthase [Planctomycetota bacterium]
MSEFPYTLRRNRISPILRDMLADTIVTANNLMYPVFVRAGKGIVNPINSMPGVSQFSCDTLVSHLGELVDKGLRAVMLFGIVDPSEKDETGSHILNEDSIVAQAIAAIREAKLDLLIAVDVCFCEYTDHGHCGVPDPITRVDNTETCYNLGTQALRLAEAGADIIAPSGMMDGAVIAIREALDPNGYSHLPIMGYSVKYASACYGPFRDAAESAPGEGDRKQYQQDIRRDHREAILEAEADVIEGVDIVMVKPGTLYLDVLARLKQEIDQPLAVYHVSGEYAMLKAAA